MWTNTDRYLNLNKNHQNTSLAWKGKQSVKIMLDISGVNNALKLYISSKKNPGKYRLKQCMYYVL